MRELSPMGRDLKGNLHTPEGFSPRIGYQSLFSIALIYNLGGFPYANNDSQSFPGDPVMEYEENPDSLRHLPHLRMHPLSSHVLMHGRSL